jgi:dihydroorotate dehydrogenase
LLQKLKRLPEKKQSFQVKPEDCSLTCNENTITPKQIERAFSRNSCQQSSAAKMPNRKRSRFGRIEFTTRNQSSNHLLSTGQQSVQKQDNELELLHKVTDQIYKPVKLKYDPYIDNDETAQNSAALPQQNTGIASQLN